MIHMELTMPLLPILMVETRQLLSNLNLQNHWLLIFLNVKIQRKLILEMIM